MEPINGLGALSEIVRRKLREGSASVAPRDDATTTQSNLNAPRQLAVGELEKQLRIKLRELGPSAAQSPAARRSIVASLLLCELDERLHNEPKFHALVRTVQSSIDSDERLRAKFDAVLEQLAR
jgi:hypothetical protein